RHRDALLGPFADPEQGVELTFVRGHVFSARIRPSTIPPDDRIATLLSLPSARFVWSLAIEAESHEAYRALARSRHPSIRRLEMGRRPDVELKASPGPLARALPRLRELVLSGPVRNFETKDLLHLSRLELRAAEPWPETLPRLMSAEWPALEALVVWLGAKARAAELAPLFEGAIVPRLRELGLCDTTITNHVCRALARSPLLARLRAIDLSLGTMTDGGAAAIGAAAAAFAQVEALDPTSNLLTPIGEEYLRMAVPRARTEGQRPGYGQGLRAPGFAASDRA
ncbi:MAG: hypothetical protein K8H88_27400, partial [Sandaracinaceae bacterium]|nr:hypothetical protein [Sandaracinaceae bacterium]